jgi:hypothetical protein
MLSRTLVKKLGKELKLGYQSMGSVTHRIKILFNRTSVVVIP